MSIQYKKWPSKSRFIFKDGRDNIYFEETEIDLDLSDSLMLNWPHNQRTVYLHLSTKSKAKKWAKWSAENVEAIEMLIKYDLTFDGYRVLIERMGQFEVPCSENYIWKLTIRYF